MKANLTRQYEMTVKIFLAGIAIAVSAASCGNDDKSPSEAAKAATDAVPNKPEKAKDAVAPTTESTRKEEEGKLGTVSTDLKAKLEHLEVKYNEEVIPEYRDINKKRLEALKAAKTEADHKLDELKAATDVDWKVKREATRQSFEDAKKKLESAISRQNFRDEAAQKLHKVEARITRLKEAAQNAKADAKKRIDEERVNLEEKSEELKTNYNRFQTSADDKWPEFKDRLESLFNSFAGLFENNKI